MQLKYKPHSLLQKFIDFYWIIKTDSNCLKVPVFAYATTDLFVSLGNTKSKTSTYMPGRMYLSGPATSTQFSNCQPSNVYIGIRFKPGGFPLFYNIPLVQMVDHVVEFHDKPLSLILDMDELLPSRLDAYFLSKRKDNYHTTSMADAVYKNKGRISVDLLAKECNVSSRTLERHFYTYMGICPKEFINIVRFKQTLFALQAGYARGDFGRIAISMGYYDQSHFIKEVKKRTGLSPSAIFATTNFL